MKYFIKIKRLVAALLVVALALTWMPVGTMAASTDDFFWVETAKTAVIREKNKEKGKKITSVPENTLLMVTDEKWNVAGNLWYQVLLPTGQTGYVFSGSVRDHQCEYELVDDDYSLAFCKCGNLIAVDDSDTRRISAATAVAPTPLIDPDLLNALRDLGGAVIGAASATVPYIGVTLAGGTFVYLVVSITKHAAVLDDVKTDWKKLNKDYRPDEGIYYNAYSNRRAFYIDVHNPMDMAEAQDTIDVSLMINAVFGETAWSIYTLRKEDARALADSYVKRTPGFKLESEVPDAHTTGSLMKQLLHFHIIPVFEPLKNNHMGGHICFGSPMLNGYNSGAWA